MSCIIRLKKILFFTTILFLFNCSHIEDKAWKYGHGYHIGDWIEFGNSYIITNDTIFKNKIPVAKVIDFDIRISDELLIIEKLNDTIKGTYCSKGNIK